MSETVERQDDSAARGASQGALEKRAFVRKDGTRSSLLVKRAAGRPDAPVVVCMPAMGVEARYYTPLLEALASAGVHAAATDLRGKGDCSLRPAKGIDFGYQTMVEVDWPAAMAQVREAFPSSRIFLLGHSLGGQLSALFLSVDPGAADGLILVGSCSNHFKGWPWPWRWPVLVGTQAASVIAGALGYFPGRSLRFAGTESRGVIQDWARQARTGRYEPEGATHPFESTLQAVQKPVLAISIENDFFAPVAAVDFLCGKMTQAKLTRWHYRPASEDAKYIDHFRWAKRPQPIVDRVVAWLAER